MKQSCRHQPKSNTASYKEVKMLLTCYAEPCMIMVATSVTLEWYFRNVELKSPDYSIHAKYSNGQV